MRVLRTKSGPWAFNIDSAHEVLSVVQNQYIKMRAIKGHTVEADVEHNSNYELNDMAYHVTFHNSQLPDEDWLEYAKKRAPNWNVEWLERTRQKSYKDRLKVGISLLIAELERVMYLENQRTKANDSSTTSNTGNPESDRPGECAGAE